MYVEFEDGGDYIPSYGWNSHLFYVRILNDHSEDIFGECEMTSFPSNCSIAIMNNVSELMPKHIKAILDYIAEGVFPAELYSGQASCVQVTVNNKTQLRRFRECGFKIVHKYRSRGSGNMIYVLMYNF